MISKKLTIYHPAVITSTVEEWYFENSWFSVRGTAQTLALQNMTEQVCDSDSIQNLTRLRRFWQQCEVVAVIRA